jgi:hypothetical protein
MCKVEFVFETHLAEEQVNVLKFRVGTQSLTIMMTEEPYLVPLKR